MSGPQAHGPDGDDVDLRRPTPVEVTIDCQSARHRIRITGARAESLTLEALDHDDLEGEQTLAALGGEPCACAEAASTWHAFGDDLRVLVLTSRGPGDPLLPGDPAAGGVVAAGTARLRRVVAVAQSGGPRRVRPAGVAGGTILGVQSAAGPTARAIPAARHTVPVPAGATPIPAGATPTPAGATTPASATPPPAGGTAATPPPQPSLAPLIDLLRLHPGVGAALATRVAARWAVRVATSAPEVGPAQPALLAALYGRAVPALRLWLHDADLEAQVEMLPAGGTGFIEQRGGTAVAHLPFSWVAEVADRHLTVILDRFVVGITEGDASTLTLLTVGRDLRPASPLLLAAR